MNCKLPKLKARKRGKVHEESEGKLHLAPQLCKAPCVAPAHKAGYKGGRIKLQCSDLTCRKSGAIFTAEKMARPPTNTIRAMLFGKLREVGQGREAGFTVPHAGAFRGARRLAGQVSTTENDATELDVAALEGFTRDVARQGLPEVIAVRVVRPKARVELESMDSLCQADKLILGQRAKVLVHGAPTEAEHLRGAYLDEESACRSCGGIRILGGSALIRLRRSCRAGHGGGPGPSVVQESQPGRNQLDASKAAADRPSAQVQPKLKPGRGA
mmetsp:Transcript_4542/g.14385  ORF Transcript_4542/g.14385 Transcript_4542/m.14385 type:complete len:271 (+) Transcript_4542:945-1757(+)